jgi:hypothetical protein
LCLVTSETVEQISGLHGRKANLENAELNSLCFYNIPYFLEYPMRIFLKKLMPKSWVHGLFASKLTATHYSYLAVKHIPEGGSQLLCWHSYPYVAHTISDESVHHNLFTSECQLYIMILNEKN